MYYLVLLSALLACAAGVPLSDTKPRLDGRIVGGNTTTIQRFPFEVSLQFSGSHICSGSIISANWVVTAAHCIVGNTVSSFSVRSGSTFSNSGGTIHSVTRIIRHPNYNSNTLDFDVALVRVSPAFTFSSVAQPIALERNTVPYGTPVFVIGWGRTSEGGSASTTLRYVILRTMSCFECNFAPPNFGSKICVGIPNGSGVACQFDSGEALVSTGRLVGIGSWGVRCAHPQCLEFFTRVSAVYNWITANAV